MLFGNEFIPLSKPLESESLAMIHSHSLPILQSRCLASGYNNHSRRSRCLLSATLAVSDMYYAFGIMSHPWGLDLVLTSFKFDSNLPWLCQTRTKPLASLWSFFDESGDLPQCLASGYNSHSRRSRCLPSAPTPLLSKLSLSKTSCSATLCQVEDQ